MTINVISDLHNLVKENTKDEIDWMDFDTSKLKKADVLVVAGDLANTQQEYPIVEKALKELPQFKKVICIPGNHDFWYGEYKRPKNQIVKMDDVVFLCTVLWTPLNFKTNNFNDDFFGQLYIVGRMVDYRVIWDWTVDQNNAEYEYNYKWLKKNIAKYKKLGKKVVVVTHHSPSMKLVDKKFEGSYLNKAFHVADDSCEKLKPDLWIHGHSHEFLKKTIDGVVYIRNPIGYRYPGRPHELPEDHWYNTVVRV